MEKKNPIDEYLNKKLGMDEPISEKERAKFDELAKQTVTISGEDFGKAVADVAMHVLVKRGLKAAFEFLEDSADLMRILFDKNNDENKEGEN